MIDRQRGGIIIFECDSCDAVLDTKTKDFDEARVAMRDDGWHARKVCGEWLHGCDSPECNVNQQSTVTDGT